MPSINAKFSGKKEAMSPLPPSSTFCTVLESRVQLELYRTGDTLTADSREHFLFHVLHCEGVGVEEVAWAPFHISHLPPLNPIRVLHLHPQKVN